MPWAACRSTCAGGQPRLTSRHLVTRPAFRALPLQADEAGCGESSGSAVHRGTSDTRIRIGNEKGGRRRRRKHRGTVEGGKFTEGVQTAYSRPAHGMRCHKGGERRMWSDGVRSRSNGVRPRSRRGTWRRAPHRFRCRRGPLRRRPPQNGRTC